MTNMDDHKQHNLEPEQAQDFVSTDNVIFTAKAIVVADDQARLDPNKGILGKKIQAKGGGSSTYAKVGGIIADHFADAGNLIATGETDLYSDTMPANLLDTNGHKIVATYGCTFVNSVSTKRLKIYFGGTNIFDTGALTISASSEISVYVLIIRDGATSVRYVVSANTTGASTGSYSAVGTITGLTLTSTQILKITGTAGGAGTADNDIVAKLATIEFDPAYYN